MTKFRGSWNVRRYRRSHYIRSIGREGWATIPERLVGTVGELGCIVLWVDIQLDACQTRPSLDERMGDLVWSEDGVDAFEGNGCVEDLGHLLYPRKNVVGPELADGQWCTDKHRISTLGTRGDGENEI